MNTNQVRELIPGITVSKKDGVFTVRRGFFYSHGGSAEKFAERVKSAIPNATILDCGEVWKPFRGGASVANSSHWWVKFSLAPEVVVSG